MTNDNISKMNRIGIALALLYLPYSIARAQQPSISGAENLLSGNCSMVLSTKSLPEEIKTAFASATKEPSLSLADPGEPFQADDVIVSNHPPPIRRLIFAGECDGRWFVYYEHGGFTHNYRVLIFNNGHPPTPLLGSVGIEKANTLDELRSELASGKLRVSGNKYW